MVRVGGGWVALDEFLLKNDPCRGTYFNILMVFTIEIAAVLFSVILNQYSLLLRRADIPIFIITVEIIKAFIAVNIMLIKLEYYLMSNCILINI